MTDSFRRVLASVLSLSLILSSPVYLHAEPENPSAAVLPADWSREINEANDYHRQYADLEKVGEGQPKSSLAPDRFLLLEQEVLPKDVPVVKTFFGHMFRMWRLNTLIAKTKAYETALENGATAEPFATSMSDADLKTAIFEHVTNGRRTDTPLFLWQRQKDPEQLKRIEAVLNETLQRWQFNDRQGYYNTTEAPYERKVRNINWWDVDIQIQQGDEVVKSLPMSATAGGRDTGSQPYFCAGENCRFNIMKGKTALNVFGIQAQIIGTFDSYVIFTHSDSYDPQTGVQYISFLDLGAYNGLLGNEAIPVFRLPPMKIDGPIRSMQVRGSRLVINDKYYIERSKFDDASDLQQVAFNLQANLVSPESWEKVLPLVDSFQEYFKKTVGAELDSKVEEAEGLKEAELLMPQLGREIMNALQAQKLIKPKTAEQHQALAKKIAGNGTQEAVDESVRLYHQRITQSSVLAKVMKQTQQRFKLSRQLMARVNLMAASLLSPRPNMSQKIKEALGSWYMSREGSGRTIMDRILSLSDRPYVNAGVLGAALMAGVAPDSFHTMVNTGLSFSNAIVDYAVGATSGLGEAAAGGTQATFVSLYNPVQSLGKAYVENGNWWRTGVGLSAFLTFLGSLYFVPHFYFNLKELYKDLKKPGMQGFIARQNKFREAYFARLAADEGSRRHFGTEVTFTPEEEQKIQAFLAERKTEIANRGIFKRLGGKIKSAFSGLFGHANPVEATIMASADTATMDLENVAKAGDQSPQLQEAVKQSDEEFKSFWAAAKHFAFSMPALELTLENWVRIWNSWATWRFTTVGFGYVRVLGSDLPLYLKFKPISFAARLLFPDFLSTSLFKRSGRAVVPTEMNGGTRNRCSQIYQKVCGLMGFNSSPENVDPRKQLKALKAFEDQIIGVEDQVIDVAFHKALEALPKYMQNKDDLKILFGSTSLDSITQKDITRLSWASQTFVRSYFESIYQSAMQKFMSQTVDRAEATEATADLQVDGLATGDIGDVDPEQENAQRTLTAMKKALVDRQAPQGEQAQYGFDLEAAKSAALAVADDPQHFKNAEEAVNRGRLSLQNFSLNAKYNLVTDLDPKQNKSMARVEVVNRRLQSPGALARAVRYEISKLKYTMPIDLTFKLLLSAGIYEGAMKPIQDSLWGPNSTFYLSHTSFYMMMASGFFMSMMADSWVKLQNDARQDDMGEFGQIPQGEDAQRSFFSWYYKQLSAKENSLMKNWGFSNTIAWWNLPAALTNIGLFYWMFSGRVDLSLLLSGYVVSFGTPISALHYKVDQAFERAAHFAARGIQDEKWMSHPQVQQMLVPEMQRYRDRFTLVNDIYGNIQGNWLGNIEMIPTSMGARGFQRALFGGGLLEEYIVNYAINPLQNAVNGVPVLGHIVTPALKACEALLTHGNVDLKH